VIVGYADSSVDFVIYATDDQAREILAEVSAFPAHLMIGCTLR
jgi:hypothetical protein